MNVQSRHTVEDKATLDEHHSVDVMTAEEARTAFDCAARRYLKMSGDEFLRKWEADEFGHDPDQPGVMDLVMLLPLVR